MLEKFTKYISDVINTQEEQLMRLSLDTVQGFFEMQDINKFLKCNAITAEQIERADSFEENFQSTLKKLYVPDYQSINV